MNDEKWHDVVDMLKERTNVISINQNPIVDHDMEGHERVVGFEDIVIFNTKSVPSSQRMKLVRKTTRVVVRQERKFHRKRGVAVTELVYSENPEDKVRRVELYRFDSSKDEWVKVNFTGVFSM